MASTNLLIAIPTSYIKSLQPCSLAHGPPRCGRGLGSFGCNLTLLNLNWKSGRKNAFLPDLTRVCGSTGCTDVCNLKPSDSIWSSNQELEAPDLNWRQDLSSDSICGKVRQFLACFLGGQRNIKNLWLKSSWTGIQPNSRLRIRLELQINSILNWIWGL